MVVEYSVRECWIPWWFLRVLLLMRLWERVTKVAV